MDYIILMVLMIAMLYFFMIRPENKRKKETENLRKSLAVGDEIVTIGAITGTICAVKENTVVFETGADRVRIEIEKWGVSSKKQKPGEGKKDSSKNKADKDKDKDKEK